eukprot:TRINITY_DN9094_c0_g1_i1.p1 TRINITY_DN9094_c0_g1~~TRINITY_DN9094_c0_g1_i1.p1  ORF type:complete len:355 (-),score=81.76 TRINITY_DN9094_c0_g1_i1:364-1428(-)
MAATAPVGANTLVGHTEPLADCVDYTGHFNVSKVNAGGKVLAENSNNPECYANMVWAQKNAEAHPEMYPPGSKTMADFQCALFLKGDVPGDSEGNQPGPAWNCTRAPCTTLSAPISETGAGGTASDGEPAGPGTAFCVRKAPPPPLCSALDGVNKSTVYPCTCPGTTTGVCDAVSRPICHPEPLGCQAAPPPAPAPLEKPAEEHMPLWVPILVVALVAALVGAGAFIAMRMRKPAKPPAKKRVAATKSAAPAAPRAEEAPPTLEPQQPLLLPQPIVTTAMPLPTASLVQAPPMVAAPPMMTAAPVMAAAPVMVAQPQQMVQVLQPPVDPRALTMAQPSYMPQQPPATTRVTGRL